MATDLIDIFYRDINKLLDNKTNTIIQKNLLGKTGQIDLIPINLAKGELDAIKSIKVSIASLYKEYKANLNKSIVE